MALQRRQAELLSCQASEPWFGLSNLTQPKTEAVSEQLPKSRNSNGRQKRGMPFSFNLDSLHLPGKLGISEDGRRRAGTSAGRAPSDGCKK